MKKILFVCVHNSCRSQMAEGFANYYGVGKIIAKSAGTQPSGEVDAIAVKVMNEKGISIAHQRSKPVDSWEWPDKIIVMGCSAEQACPAVFLDKVENWDLEDPKGKSIEFYRKIRDQIETLVKEMIENL